MKAKKLWWYVAVSYADDETDIVRSDDYEKALNFALAAWRDECEQYMKTKESGVLGVQFFDGAGRVLWCSNDEPDGLGTTGYFEHVQQHLKGKGMGPALGPIEAITVGMLR